MVVRGDSQSVYENHLSHDPIMRAWMEEVRSKSYQKRDVVRGLERFTRRRITRRHLPSATITTACIPDTEALRTALATARENRTRRNGVKREQECYKRKIRRHPCSSTALSPPGLVHPSPLSRSPEEARLLRALLGARRKLEADKAPEPTWEKVQDVQVQ